MAGLSMRQYAKLRGVSVEAVSKAVRTGRITCKRNKLGHAEIDPEVANREWDSNSDPDKFRYSGPVVTPPLPPPPEPPPKPAPVAKPKQESEPDKPSEISRGASVRQSSEILKEYQARLAKLEFDERSEKLLDAEQVKKDAFKLGRSVRDSLLGIPDRLSAELAGETDQFTIRQRLDTEIRQALENLREILLEEKK